MESWDALFERAGDCDATVAEVREAIATRRDE